MRQSTGDPSALAGVVGEPERFVVAFCGVLSAASPGHSGLVSVQTINDLSNDLFAHTRMDKRFKIYTYMLLLMVEIVTQKVE